MQSKIVKDGITYVPEAELKKDWEAWRGHCEYYLYFKCIHCKNKKSECNFPECPVRRKK